MGRLTPIPPNMFDGGAGLSRKGAGKPSFKDLMAERDALLEAVAAGQGGPLFNARFATTANINLATTALTAIDGVTPVAGDIALVKNQSTASQNGLYVVSSGAWTRLKSNGKDVISAGMVVEVAEGSVNADKQFVLTTDAPITVDTTSLTYAASVGTSATASNATPTALDGTGAAGSGTNFSRDDHKHAYGAGSIATAALAASSVTPAKQSIADADGLAGLITIRKAFTAAGPGSADDVNIYVANAPFAMRILDVILVVATAISGKTVTLRDAASGGGNALSDALSATSTGYVRNTALTATRTIAANGSLIIRRSDNGVAGELIILAQKV